MKLKPALQLFLPLQAAAALALFMSGGYIALDIFKGTVSVPALVVVAISATIMLLKRKIARFILPRVNYPGIFYDVSERRSLLDVSFLDDAQAVLNDLYHPQYSTAQFLYDNGLDNEIGNKEDRRNAPPIFAFTPEGLVTRTGIIPWPSVYDWSISKKIKGGITIQFVEPEKPDLTMYPYHLRQSDIEILMLLAHYKHKYGNEDVLVS